MSARAKLHLINLGRMSYGEALGVQKYFARIHLDALSEDNSRVAKNVLLIVEHNPVYTIGLRTKDYTIKDQCRLKSLGAEFYKTNRGGLITFHGIGQLVAYPVINLKHFMLGMRSHVRTLEELVIKTCQHFGIEAVVTEDTGIWVKNKKICALGVHGKRFITTHGLALNCNTDLTWFDHIVPCGIEGKGVTSLSEETNRDINVEDVLPVLLSSFAEHFSCDLINYKNDKQFKTTSTD